MGRCCSWRPGSEVSRSLLVERGDFGGETSFQSLRIVHGGLRYLQALDLPRFFESVRERRWFLRTFPELVTPLPCLMPLYGEGLRRQGVLGAALCANDLLSAAPQSRGGSRSQAPCGSIDLGRRGPVALPGCRWLGPARGRPSGMTHTSSFATPAHGNAALGLCARWSGTELRGGARTLRRGPRRVRDLRHRHGNGARSSLSRERGRECHGSLGPWARRALRSRCPGAVPAVSGLERVVRAPGPVRLCAGLDRASQR